MKDNDSLEATIRELNQVDSLQVVTMASPENLPDARYREDCAYRLADIVAELANLLGTGRQFIP